MELFYCFVFCVAGSKEKREDFWFDLICFLLNMLVISSEGGRLPPGLIYACVFWMVCFGIFVGGYSKDKIACIVRPDKEFPAAIPALDEIKQSGDDSLTNSISIN